MRASLHKKAGSQFFLQNGSELDILIIGILSIHYWLTVALSIEFVTMYTLRIKYKKTKSAH